MRRSAADFQPAPPDLRAAASAVLLLITALVASAAAQPFYTLSGIIRDATDRVLPNARLVLTNPANQSKYEVRSDATGRYEFVGLAPAAYDLQAESAGFRTATETIALSSTTAHDIQLRVGTLQETITVGNGTAAPPDASAREAARQRFEALRARTLEICADPSRNPHVGGNIMPPRKVLDVRPGYPVHLREAGVGGVVTMDATIGTDGRIREIDNLKGPHPDLEAAAADAVRLWEFSATWLNCEAIEVEMRVTVNFAAR